MIGSPVSFEDIYSDIRALYKDTMAFIQRPEIRDLLEDILLNLVDILLILMLLRMVL